VITINFKKRKFYLLTLLVLVFSLALNINTAPVQAGSDELPSLHEAYSEYFSIGAAVNSSTINTHRNLIEKHFNSLTAENEMKFDHLQPREGFFTFSRADEIVKLARENNMKVRGHVLVWHSQTPDWVFVDKGKTASREVLLERMENHIKTVVERYKDDVYAWDVVNEAISDDGYQTHREDSPWYQIIGEDYIAEAFRIAHEADPEARLFYNDYNAVQPQKMNKIYNMLKGLLEDGVPVHGIGIQGHWDISSPSVIDIMQAIEKYASLGLEVQITELDISVFPWNDRRKLAEPTAEMLEKQNKRYQALFNLFKRYQDELTGVILWGVADDSTWKDNHPVQGRKDWPLLFDEDHQPKGAFWEVIQAAE